ncbi:MAG TPA: hypothetical protein V6C65_14585, partial [Allocoleopsis sp.]
YLTTHPDLFIVDFIKMRLARLDPGREASNWYTSKLPTVQGVNLSNPESYENLCAFFLCRVIKRSKDWIYRYNADLLKGVEVDWSAIVGVPVEYCDSPALARFHRVLCLAWHLSIYNVDQVTLSTIDKYLRKLRSSLDISEMPCFTVPEMAAAVYSYTFSRQAKRGTYVFFDIGGGTMEGAAFRFHRNNIDETPQIDFLSGLVEPVGVNALAKRIARSSLELERKTEFSIINNSSALVANIDELSKRYKKRLKISESGSFTANKHGIPVSVIQNDLRPDNFNMYATQILMLAQSLIHRQVAAVLGDCRRKLSQNEIQNISVFLGGGGMVSNYYIDTIESTYDAFHLSSTGMPRYKMRNIPVPGDFSMSGLEEDDFHRFSIAYGLSIPDYDAPEFKLPTQMPHTPPPAKGPRWIPESGEDDG